MIGKMLFNLTIAITLCLIGTMYFESSSLIDMEKRVLSVIFYLSLFLIAIIIPVYVAFLKRLRFYLLLKPTHFYRKSKTNEDEIYKESFLILGSAIITLTNISYML